LWSKTRCRTDSGERGCVGLLAGPELGAAIDASYANGVLQDQQGMVPVVGMDRLEPVEPALEYFARAGIANGTNTVRFALTQNGATTAVVEICRADGTVIAAEMFQPFASASTPIWACGHIDLGARSL
jgi:hypothetical protein